MNVIFVHLAGSVARLSGRALKLNCIINPNFYKLACCLPLYNLYKAIGILYFRNTRPMLNQQRNITGCPRKIDTIKIGRFYNRGRTVAKSQ